MKRTILLFIVLFYALAGIAQQEIKVLVSAKEMSKGLQPSFEVNIPETDIKSVERAWTKLLQKGTRSRAKRANSEVMLSGASIDGIVAKQINVYSRLFADKGEVLLVSFYELDSVFFNAEQNAEISLSIKSFLRNFAVETYRASVMEQVKIEAQKLQAGERLTESLLDEEKRKEIFVKESQREIRNLEDGIKVNLLDQDRMLENIERQKDKIAAVREFEDEHKAAEKELKSLKRSLKKIQSQRESMHKKIDKLESGIKNAERDIRIGKEKQRMQDIVVSKQKNVLEAVQQKLNRIR